MIPIPLPIPVLAPVFSPCDTFPCMGVGQHICVKVHAVQFERARCARGEMADFLHRLQFCIGTVSLAPPICHPTRPTTQTTGETYNEIDGKNKE